MSDKLQTNNEHVLNRLAAPAEDNLSQNVWQQMAQESKGGIGAKSQGNGNPAEKLSHRQTELSSENALPTLSSIELRNIKDGVASMRRHWNEVQPNGEHIKGMEKVTTKESFLPDLSLADSQVKEKQTAATSTNILKRDHFETAKPSGKPSAFEPAIDNVDHTEAASKVRAALAGH